MPIWILERRVVNVIEQHNYLDSPVFEKIPEVRVGAHLDLERRVVNVIEQRNYLDSPVFEKIPEVRVGAHLDLERRVVNVIEQRKDRKSTRLNSSH